MKKTSILTLAASALLLTGCADEFGGLGGGKETVTFTTVLPTQVTRAYGDNISADKLFCFLYQDGKFVEAADPVKISGNTATVQMQLAKGVTYDVVFWAAKDGKTKLVAPTPAAEEETATTTTNAPYTYDEATGNLTVDYSKITPNDPYVDAYYSKYEYTGGTPKTITLYRPFAQVNVGTNDTELESVKKAYNGHIYSNIEFDAWTCMSLLDGEVTEKNSTPVSTTIAEIPNDTESYPVEPEKNKYTNMAYILVPQATSSTINFKCNFYTSTDETSKKVTRDVSNMPVQKNYRTNVYGALLTSTTDFKVQIAPAFITPDFNNPKPSVTAENANQINNLFADGKNPGAEIDIKLAQAIGDEVVINNQGTPTTINLNMNGNNLAKGIKISGPVILNVTNEEVATRSRAQRRITMNAEGSTNSALFTANVGATINLYNGQYETNDCVVAHANGGNVNFYGGWYHSTVKNSILLGRKVAYATNGGKVTAYGGYFRTGAENSATLDVMGITPDATCKVTPYSEETSGEAAPTQNIWLVVERVWHPGVDLASLEWETVGTGTFRDPWLRPSYKFIVDEYAAEYPQYNYDYANFGDLTVTIKRCKTYPTLYKIENPFITASQVWLNEPERMVLVSPIEENGAIIFDLNNTSCVPVVPNVYSGANYLYEEWDHLNLYNLEGAAYYNHQNCVTNATPKGHVLANSLENISKFSEYAFGDNIIASYQSGVTRYDKGTRTLLFRNPVFDITGPNETYTAWRYSFPLCHNADDWQAKCQGYLIFPENFVLLDVYGNPVK